MTFILDKKGFRLLVRYKCNSVRLFETVGERDLSDINNWTTSEIREYAESLQRGYIRSKRCYEGRVEFRDCYVAPHLRDDNHENAIAAAKLRSVEYLQQLTKVSAFRNMI